MGVIIRPPRVPLVDQSTGLVTKEWYRFFLHLFTVVGPDTDVTLDDFQVTAFDSQDGSHQRISNLEGNIAPLQSDGVKEDLLREPRAELGTLAQQNAERFTLPKTSGSGIRVDLSAPTFPWRDIEGLIYPDATAGPVRGTFITGVSAFSYTNTKAMDFSFHMPHDWVPGTDLYIHVHWGHNANTSVSGNVVFNFSVSYAKGHNQANFSAAVAPSITYALTDIATTPQYRHRIDEIQLSAASPTATQLDTDNLEPDGLIQGTMTVDLSGATLTTTTPVNSIYVFTIDLHYQSSGIGTKQKAPNFYV